MSHVDLLHIFEPKLVLWLIGVILEAMSHSRVIQVVQVNPSIFHLWDDLVNISVNIIELTGLKDTLWKLLHFFLFKDDRKQERILQVGFDII